MQQAKDIENIYLLPKHMTKNRKKKLKITCKEMEKVSNVIF